MSSQLCLLLQNREPEPWGTFGERQGRSEPENSAADDRDVGKAFHSYGLPTFPAEGHLRDAAPRRNESGHGSERSGCKAAIWAAEWAGTPRQLRKATPASARVMDSHIHSKMGPAWVPRQRLGRAQRGCGMPWQSAEGKSPCLLAAMDVF